MDDKCPITKDIVLIGFSEAQQLSHQFVNGHVHEICDIEDLGFINLNPRTNVRIS